MRMLEEDYNKTCYEAKILADSLGFRLLIGFKAVICVLGIFATLYSLKTSGIRWLVHVNAKVIYAFHLFWTIEVPATYFVLYLFEIIRLSIPHENPCDYTIKAAYGVTLRSVPVIGIAVQSLTMCSFAIERAVSTVYPAQYEKIKTARLGFFLGIITAVIGTTEMLVFIVLPNDFNEPQVVSAIRTTSNGSHYTVMMVLYALSEVVTVLMFIITLCANKYLCNKHRFKELGWKYQIQENNKVIKSLLPCFITHSALNLFTLSLTAAYIVIFPEYDKFTMAVWAEAVSHIHMYSLILPIIIALRLRKTKASVVNGHADSNAYFAHMAEYFNGQPAALPKHSSPKK